MTATKNCGVALRRESRMFYALPPMHKHTCKHQEIAVRYRKLLLLAVISSEKYRKHTTDRVCTTFKKVMKFLKVLFVLCLCELFHKFLLHYLVRLIDTFTTNIVHFHNKHCSTSVMVSCFEVSWLMCKQLWKKYIFLYFIIQNKDTKACHTAILWKQEAVII